MDCLARSLGLDIEALAKQLAVAKDTAYIKPSQCTPIQKQEKSKLTPIAPLSQAEASARFLRPLPVRSPVPTSNPAKTPTTEKMIIPNNFASRADNFTTDRINAAFQNLFGGSDNLVGFGGEKVGVTATPSFLDRKQIKAKDFIETTDASAKQKLSSVFSPIPCMPQSATSILGVRGDHNTPYTPFNK